MPTDNILLLTYFLVYFLLGFVWRSVMVYRRTGINPMVLPRTQDAYGYVGLAFKVMILACGLLVLLMALVPEVISAWLGNIEPLRRPAIQWVGWCLLCSAAPHKSTFVRRTVFNVWWDY